MVELVHPHGFIVCAPLLQFLLGNKLSYQPELLAVA